jgi:hypothetical protein
VRVVRVLNHDTYALALAANGSVHALGESFGLGLLREEGECEPELAFYMIPKKSPGLVCRAVRSCRNELAQPEVPRRHTSEL